MTLRFLGERCTFLLQTMPTAFRSTGEMPESNLEQMPPRVQKLLDELEAYAKRKGVKQKDLAKELGVVPQQLSDWLTGHRTPNGERILQIQEFLNQQHPKKGQP
jgi:DNA-binding transcriptional regulator YiaG